MASTIFLRCSVAVVVVLVAVACDRGRDPRPIRIGDFSSDQKLRDTLSRLVPAGTPLSAAQSLMERSGFECGNRAGIVVNPTTDKLSSGKPELQCWQSSRIFPGFKHRDWTITYRHDSSRVREV